MKSVQSVRRSLAVGAFLLGIWGSSSAQQLVSVDARQVNMRADPSLSAEILWQLGSGYPLRVVGRKGDWLHVVDFENDTGWVARRFTASTPFSIVKAPVANLRAGPGTRHRVLRQAAYGEVVRVLGTRKSWIRVKGNDSRIGWIARGLLWGQ